MPAELLLRVADGLSNDEDVMVIQDAEGFYRLVEERWAECTFHGDTCSVEYWFSHPMDVLPEASFEALARQRVIEGHPASDKIDDMLEMKAELLVLPHGSPGIHGNRSGLGLRGTTAFTTLASIMELGADGTVTVSTVEKHTGVRIRAVAVDIAWLREIFGAQGAAPVQ